MRAISDLERYDRPSRAHYPLSDCIHGLPYDRPTINRDNLLHRLEHPLFACRSMRVYGEDVDSASEISVISAPAGDSNTRLRHPALRARGRAAVMRLLHRLDRRGSTGPWG